MSDTLLTRINVAPKAQQAFPKASGTAVKDLVSMLPAYLFVAGIVTYLSLGWVL